MLNAVAVLLLVTGVVRTDAGQPIEGARITVRSGVEQSVLTDVTGEFRLLDVTLPLELTVEFDGFVTKRVTVTQATIEMVLHPTPVTASVLVLGESAGRDPATGSLVFDRATLSHAPAMTVDEALRPVAGLSLFRRSSARTANPTTHGVTMRGLSASGASRGLVIFDGMPLNDGFGAWVTWTRVPAEALQSIEVLPGAAGDLFGSDALGGVIRLRSPQPGRAAPVVTLAAGTRATRMGDASVGVSRGNTGVFLATSAVDTDGEIPLESSSRGAVDRPASAEWWNGFGRVDVVADARRWTLSALGGRDRRGNGTVAQVNRSTGATVSAAVQSVSGQSTWAMRLAVAPNHFTQTFSAVASTRATETLTSTQFIDVTTARAVIEYGRALPRGLVMLRAGATRAAAEFEERRATGTTSVRLHDVGESLSAQAAFTPSETLTIGGGVRHEWRGAPGSRDGRDQATVGRVSASWQTGPSAVVRASAATSHRWPTLNELTRGFRVGSTQTLPNADLQPERARSADVGVTLSRASVTAGLVLFTTVVDDAIANVTLPSLTGIVRQRRNAGQARARGVEADVDVRPVAWFSMRASLALTDATFQQSAEPALEGNRLPQVPRVSAALTLDIRPAPGWRLDVVARSIGTQFDDDRNVFELATARQVDGRLSMRTGRVEWGVVVENVFDGRVEVGRTPLVTLAPGRAARLSATWR